MEKILRERYRGRGGADSIFGVETHPTNRLLGVCACVFFYRRSGRVPNERRCEAVGAVERRRYVGPVTVETVQTGRDGPAGRFQQRADEPAGERMRRECRLRLFHVDETKKCDRVAAAAASAVAALVSFLPTADVAATRYHGKVIRELPFKRWNVFLANLPIRLFKIVFPSR